MLCSGVSIVLGGRAGQCGVHGESRRTISDSNGLSCRRFFTLRLADTGWKPYGLDGASAVIAFTLTLVCLLRGKLCTTHGLAE